MKRNGKESRGFTLVELLVVIGIIALLISILLPALNKARRSAATLQCGSNMRQIAMALLNYINDNKGKFPPALISAGDASAPIGLRDGWFWAAELMHQKYINAPNIYHAGSTTKDAGQNSVFRCPEGLAPEDWAGQSGLGTPYGLYPCDPNNSNYCYGEADNPRTDGQAPYGVATWYQLNTRISGYATDDPNSGTNNPPFIYFDSGKDGAVSPQPGITSPPIGAGMPGQFVYPAYQRSLGNIRKSAIVVMLAEASSVNWVDATAQGPRNGETSYFARLAARHGQVSSNGNNAYANFAFFDGHVALVPTQPMNDASYTSPSGTQYGDGALFPASGTVIILANQ